MDDSTFVFGRQSMMLEIPRNATEGDLRALFSSAFCDLLQSVVDHYRSNPLEQCPNKIVFKPVRHEYGMRLLLVGHVTEESCESSC